MTVKEELEAAIQRIAEDFKTDRIAVIVCIEGQPQWCSMMGFRHPFSPICTIATVISTKDVIEAIIGYAYETSNNEAKGV
ncbi:MAG: hypothetical protein IKL83_07565 [Muribaculaceae bacterium]|nr:hypothetical protein [Muribaculaceae bacterium]